MKRYANACYSAIQALHCANACIIGGFLSLFLLDCGYSNSTIGLLLGLCYALASLLQPLSAALFSGSRLRLNFVVAALYLAAAGLAVAVRLNAHRSPLLSVLIVSLLSLQLLMDPTINSIQRDFDLAGCRINYGLSRGIGSAAYSAASFGVGQLLRFVSPKLLPSMYAVSSLITVVILCLFRAPGHQTAAAARRKERRPSVLRQSPVFALLCLGSMCISTCHIFICSFYLQIFRNLGGGSGEQGIAIAIASIVELPTMALYAKLSRRVPCRRLLVFAGWMWVLKGMLTFIAPNAYLIYLAAFLQIASYAVYVPASVELAALLLPDDFLSAQAMLGSASMIGSLISCFAGGALIDAVGVHAALGIMQIPALVGAALWTIALLRLKKKSL